MKSQPQWIKIPHHRPTFLNKSLLPPVNRNRAITIFTPPSSCHHLPGIVSSMALKAAHVSGVPCLDHVPEAPALSLSSPHLPSGTSSSPVLSLPPFSLVCIDAKSWRFVLTFGFCTRQLDRCGEGGAKANEIFGGRAQREGDERSGVSRSSDEGDKRKFDRLFQRRWSIPDRSRRIRRPGRKLPLQFFLAFFPKKTLYFLNYHFVVGCSVSLIN